MSLDTDAVRATAETYIERWECTPDGDLFLTHSSLLWPVLWGGERCMLKIANPDDDEAMGAHTLAFYGGQGAVDVLQYDGHVQLLRRIIPDASRPSLESMVLNGADDDAKAIICDVIEKLHHVARFKPAPDHLIPFRQRSDDMRRHMDEGRIKDADRPFFEGARGVCDDLIAHTQGGFIPLHGDIHHFNIMHCAARGWLAIDPKGIFGPRAYEYANALCNPYMHGAIVANPARMGRQADIIRERAGVERDLLLRFTFVHAMQCAAWSLFEPDQGYWMACAKTAAELSKIPLPD